MNNEYGALVEWY